MDMGRMLTKFKLDLSIFFLSDDRILEGSPQLMLRLLTGS